MQYHIPQYIDIEDKLFGPLTLKQAIYVAGGAGGIYLVWRIVPYIFISAPLMFGIGLLTWALAFYPKEKLGRPFIEILDRIQLYDTRKLYTWKTTKEATAGKEETFTPRFKPLHHPTSSSASFDLDVRGTPRSKKKKSL